ncbi:MAG: hypothetical protein HY097_10345 [Nitrospinae bacterium]|nr:hypothetical protein [Nitrospinota bacterium]
MNLFKRVYIILMGLMAIVFISLPIIFRDFKKSDEDSGIRKLHSRIFKEDLASAAQDNFLPPTVPHDVNVYRDCLFCHLKGGGITKTSSGNHPLGHCQRCHFSYISEEHISMGQCLQCHVTNQVNINGNTLSM